MSPSPNDALPPALQALLSRHSQGIKHLTDPGPDEAELDVMTEAALAAPDHAGLVPFRFTVVSGKARRRLGALFAEVARASGKDADGIALEAERAERAPVTVAVIARIDLGHPVVPAHEQWVALGAALGNFLNAAHALGYAGKMLSGAKVRHPSLVAAFCEAGESLVGWIALGTATRAAASRRSNKAPLHEVLRHWPADD
jgi:nitroreductase